MRSAKIHAPRSTILILAAAMVLGLSGCGGDSSPTATSSQPAQATSPATAVKADPKLHAALPAEIRSRGVIHITTNIPYPPWEMYVNTKSKQPTGLDYDLSQALSAKLGVRGSFDQTAFDSMIPAIQAKKADIVMAGIFDTAKRETSLDFVDYAKDGFGLLVRKGNPKNIHSVSDLAGKTVAVQSSTSADTSLTKLSQKYEAEGKKPITILRFPGDTEAFLAVQSGRADFRLDSTSAGSYAAKTYGGGSAFELIQDPSVTATFGTGLVGIGVSKSNVQLRNVLRQAIQALIADGTYRTILAKYGGASLAVTSAQINEGPKVSIS